MEVLDSLYLFFILMAIGILFTSIIKNKYISGLITSLLTVAASLPLLYSSFNILIESKKIEKEIISIAPFLNSSLSICIDGLSALFLLIISIISLCVSMFSWKYLTKYSQPCQRFYPFLFALFASSVGVVCVKDLFFFIIFWELMTLNSWFLVIFDRESATSLKAGLQYFIVTHVATGFLILASVILYSVGNTFDFVTVKESFSRIFQNNSLLSNFLLLCIFIAFVTKAGVLPFGFWLPNTYPQPPASAGSFFGGVMSKLAVYAMFRFFCSVIPMSSYTQWWGFVVAAAGTFSIFIGTIAALTQDEAKKLMSFHAIGQVGYMLLGLGVGLYYINTNTFLSAVALTGGLLHLFNNSIYKSLLFLNAGSIFYKTGTTDLNKLSGLITLMPTVTLTALVASLSIAGVPLFNGFVSKLLIFESSVWSANQTESFFLVRGIFVVFGIISIFISAVTLASFLKFVNSVFMGKLKQDYGREKIHWSMNLSQIILAILCIIIGIFPSLFIKMTFNAISSLEIPMPSLSNVFITEPFGINISFCSNCSAGAWFPLFIIIPLVVLSVLIFSFEKYAKTPKREVPTWYGGKEHQPEDVVYTGHSFYQPFKDLVSFKIKGIQFKGFYPVNIPSLKISIPSWIPKVLYFDEWLYYPLARNIQKLFIIFGNIYSRATERYIIWLIIGSLFVLWFVLKFAEVKV